MTTKSNRIRTVLLAGVATMTLGAAAIAPSADAQTPAHGYSIASQDLASALRAFALASGRDVVFDPALVRGKSSGGLQGAIEDDAALTDILVGTGLTFAHTASGGFVIHASPQGEGAQGESPPPTKVGEVVVTGSNIRGAQPVGAKLTVLDAQTIQQSGYSTIDELLQAQPTVFRGGAASGTPDGQNFGTGSLAGENTGYGSGINLRGLGDAATLTLLDGQRMVGSSAGTLVDVSMIPTSAIERIEILPDGASAVYGADAVAGVVNIILKDHYDGAQTRVRYGASTEGGRDEYQLGQTFGSTWQGGHALFSVDYLDQDPLLASQRSATSDGPGPTDVFPSNKSLSLFFSGGQHLNDKLSINTDLLYSHADRDSVFTYDSAFYNAPVKIDRLDSIVVANYDFWRDWRASLSGDYGREEDQLHFSEQYPVNGPVTYSSTADQVQQAFTSNLILDGTLFTMPAGPAKVSIGYSYMRGQYNNHEVEPGLPNYRVGASRSVNAEFAEINIPLFSPSNSAPLIHSAALSLAVRHDSYSDFGSTTNPKFGLSWSPIEDLALRSSWGTSFRAPSVGYELQTSQTSSVPLNVLADSGTNGSSEVPIAVLIGSKKLTAEHSRDFSAGATYKPGWLPKLSIDIDYFSIDYTNQITTPPYYVNINDPALATFLTTYPTPAALNQALAPYLAAGAPYLDFTGGQFGPNPLSVTTILYDERQLNAAKTRIDGFDVSGHYASKLGAGLVRYDIAMTYLKDYLVTPTAGAPVISEVNTLGYPASLKGRADVNWSQGPITATAAVNYVGAYKDNTSTPYRNVSAFTTVDFNASVRINPPGAFASKPFLVRLSVTDAFDAKPPYIFAVQAPQPGSHYDSANADPLGRYVAVDLTWDW